LINDLGVRVVPREASAATVKLLLELCKASTGKSPGRAAIPDVEETRRQTSASRAGSACSCW